MTDASATMKQVFSGDAAQLVAEYKKLAAENVKLELANKRMAQESRKGAEEASRGQKLVEQAVGGAARAVAASVASWLSVRTVIAGVNQDLEEFHRLSSRAAGVQVSAGRAQADLLKNLVGGTPAERAAYVGRVAALQKETSYGDVNMLYAAAAGGLSAGGSREDVLAAVREAAKVSPFNPEELQTLVESQLHLGRATGVRDPQQLLGFLLGAQATSPISSLQQTARNLSPAVLSTMATVRGDPKQAAREAAAAFSTLTQFGGDLRGESGRTAQISLATQLNEFFTEGVVTGTGRGKRTIKPEMDPGTFSGRMAALQADKALQDAFLANATFEKQFEEPVKLWVRGGRTAAGASPSEFFADAVKTIDFNAASTRQLQEENRNLTRQIQTASIANQAKAAEEQMDFAGASEDAIARAILFGGELGDKTLEGAIPRTRRYSEIPFGMRNLVERPYFGAQMAATDNPAQTAIDILRQRQQEILLDDTAYWDPQQQRTVTRSPQSLRGREAADFKFLADQIAALTRVMEQVAKSNQEMNERDKQPQAGAAPAARAQRGVHRER